MEYLIIHRANVKRCVAAGVSRINVRAVEYQVLQMPYAAVATGLQIRTREKDAMRKEGSSRTEIFKSRVRSRTSQVKKKA